MSGTPSAPLPVITIIERGAMGNQSVYYWLRELRKLQEMIQLAELQLTPEALKALRATRNEYVACVEERPWDPARAILRQSLELVRDILMPFVDEHIDSDYGDRLKLIDADPGLDDTTRPYFLAMFTEYRNRSRVIVETIARLPRY